MPLLFKMEGSVYIRSLIFALPSSLLSLLIVYLDREFPEYREDIFLVDLKQSQVWTATTVILMFLLGFRTRQSLQRFWEGTGLLHQMKGEWFDTVSNCITFSIKSNDSKRKETEAFRHTIVRLMSLCHGSALEEISGMEGTLETIDVLGLSNDTLRHLKDCVENHCFNKVEVLLHLLQSCITNAHQEGILAVPPPILSRVYQTISRGYVNLLNTKKITDTKFPFPFVQVISLLLIIHTIMTPYILATTVKSLVVTPILTFVFVFGAFALNFISMELEDPFGEDDNDLPLADFQAEMNNCLMMLLHNNTDIIAGISSRCFMDFDKLKSAVSTTSTMHMRESVIRRSRSSHKVMIDEAVLRDDDCADWNGFSHEVDISECDANPPRDVSASPAVLQSVLPESTPPESPHRAQPCPCQVLPCALMPEREPPPLPQVLETAATNIPEAKGDSERCLLHKPDLTDPKQMHKKQVQQMLVNHMSELNESLHSWTEALESQVLDLTQRFTSLAELGECIGAHRGLSREIKTDSGGYAMMVKATRRHSSPVRSSSSRGLSFG